MKITVKHLRQLIREELEGEVPDPEFVELLNRYIGDSRTMSSSDRKRLAEKISGMRLNPGLVLERVSSSIPGEVGDTIGFDVVSFTTVSISSGKNAGQIVWKSVDKCLMRIENPTRGYEVDYNLVKQLFDAPNEKEVILTGNYRIVSREMVTEPGTKPQYGYTVPMFFLEEI